MPLRFDERDPLRFHERDTVLWSVSSLLGYGGPCVGKPMPLVPSIQVKFRKAQTLLCLLATLLGVHHREYPQTDAPNPTL